MRQIKSLIIIARILTTLFLLCGMTCGSFGQAAERPEASTREMVAKTLEQIRQQLALSDNDIHNLAQQVDQLKEDQKLLRARLVEAARKEREASEDIARAGQQLEKLLQEKKQSSADLVAHRDEFAQLLSILERMGLKPPPALLVKPDDVLAAIRSAILLGALVPDMRETNDLLLKKLRRLTQLGQSIEQQIEHLKYLVREQAEQKERLELLLVQKLKTQELSQSELEKRRQANAQLAAKAHSMQELLNELQKQGHERDKGQQAAEMKKLAQNLHLSKWKGKLIQPVSGRLVKNFTGLGLNQSQGETIQTEAGAIVSAPAEAMVVFAGSFRSYGQLVILDGGDDYYILLSGLAKLYVAAGQLVLAGEPLGQMRSESVGEAKLDIGKPGAFLYIELRKNGVPINPASWWEKR